FVRKGSSVEKYSNPSSLPSFRKVVADEKKYHARYPAASRQSKTDRLTRPAQDSRLRWHPTRRPGPTRRVDARDDGRRRGQVTAGVQGRRPGAAFDLRRHSLLSRGGSRPETSPGKGQTRAGNRRHSRRQNHLDPSRATPLPHSL